MPALAKLFKAWLGLTEEQKLAQVGKDARILAVAQKEIAQLGCPATEGDLVAWVNSNRLGAAAKS